MPDLKFYPSVGGQEITGTGTDVSTVKVMVYDDGAGNKYTLDFSAISTPQGIPKLQYLSKGGVAGTDEIDFSNLTQLVSFIGAINTNVGTINTAVGKGAGSLGAALGALDGKVGEVKAKTDNMPDNLKTELAPLTAAAGKITAIETVVGSSPLAPMLTGLAQQTTLTALDGKVGLVKDKTDNMPDNLKTELAPLTAAAGKITAIETVVGSSPLAPMLTGLAQQTTLTALGSEVNAIKTQTNPIPTNLTARLNALDLADANAPGSLGKALSELAKALKGIQDKTDNLDPEDTAEGTLGKALETISAEATANLNALKALLEALNPDASSKSLLSATLKEIKDKTDKLDLKNTDTDSGTLGEALEAIRLEAGTVSLDLKTLTACVDALKPEAPEQESPQSNSGHTPNEDIWGIQ